MDGWLFLSEVQLEDCLRIPFFMIAYGEGMLRAMGFSRCFKGFFNSSFQLIGAGKEPVHPVTSLLELTYAVLSSSHRVHLDDVHLQPKHSS